MSISKITGLLLSSAAMVAGHGYVSGAVVDGTYHGGFLVNSYNYMSEVPTNIGWAEKATDLGFVDGSSYASSDIICHKEATPGAISAEVKAGGKVELQWTEWPESHHGPVITYMANCNGDCSKVDKTTLKFFKIAEAGLIDDSNVPGKWASDELIANNNSATVTIPSAIAAGNYVLRHEIIALHSAGEENGAQNYPQCINLKVTGGGSDAPDGVLGTALYKATDPGIKISIYTSLDSYDIPGPALYTGAASGSSSGSATTTAAATTAPATTAAPTAASTVSASPIQSSSRHLTRTRTFTPSGTPTPSSAPTSAASTYTASEPGSEPTEAPSTVTETATSTASSAPQYTDEPDTQTASSPADSVSITSTASGQSAQSTTPASGGDGSESSASASATATAAPTAAASSSSSSSSSSGSSSSDYSSYLSSLSAEKLLEVIRSTLKWLVSDSKVHARALSH